MIDKEIVYKHLKELDKVIKQLKKYQKISFKDFQNNLDIIWAVEHGLQMAIQNLLDIGGYILSSLCENNIDEYSDIITRLGQRNIIPQKFAKKIFSMAGFRNLLVHEYIKIDIKRVHSAVINNLDDFIAFSKHIKMFLEK